jgi:hypothetical protein
MFPPAPRSLAALCFLMAVPLPGAAQPQFLARLGERQSRHHKSVLSLEFAADGRTLATLDSEGTIRLWDIAGRKQRASWGDDKTPFRCLAFSPAARILATASDKDIRLWDLTGRALRSLPHSLDEIAAIRFSADGKVIAVAQHCKSGFDKAPVRLFDVRRGEAVQKIEVPTENDPLMTFLPDSAALAVWGRQWTFWDVGSGADLTPYFIGANADRRKDADAKRVFHFRRQNLSGALCVFSPNGRLLAIAEQGSVRVYDVRTGWQRYDFWSGPLRRLQFSADSRILVGSKNDVKDMVYFWEANTGRFLSPFVCLHRAIDAEALGPDGTTLAAAMDDGTIELHDIRPEAWKRVRRSGLASWELQRCWRELRSLDGWSADQAAWMLAADAKKSLPLLREQLQRCSSDEEIGRLIQQLDSDSFAVRDASTKQLQCLGLAAEPALRRVLMEKPTLELRRRTKDLLEVIDKSRTSGPTGESLRAVRAIRALERMDAKEAHEILEDLARGGSGEWQTQEAREAAQRRKLRSP